MTADAMTLAVPRRQRLSFGRFIALLIIALLVIWTAVPLFMAVMWSLVNPDDPWSPPAVLPPSLSLARAYLDQLERSKGLEAAKIAEPQPPSTSQPTDQPTATQHQPTNNQQMMLSTFNSHVNPTQNEYNAAHNNNKTAHDWCQRDTTKMHTKSLLLPSRQGCVQLV